MKKQKSRSTLRPPEWDKDSSPHVVYHRENIVEIQASGDDPTYYEYDETEYTRDEFVNEIWDIATQQRADIDYLEMMIGE